MLLGLPFAGWAGRKCSRSHRVLMEKVCLSTRHHVHYMLHVHRPLYQDEPTPTSEVVEEEMSEVSLSHVEDQLEDSQPDSEDEAAVFLDIASLGTAKDVEVHMLASLCEHVMTCTYMHAG